MLRPHIAESAFCYAQCHPQSDGHKWVDGTRILPSRKYIQWIMNTAETPSFFLVAGSVGTGKTALMCRHIDYAIGKGHTVLHFHFSRNDERRDSLRFVITTFAYQLILSKPKAGRIVQEAIASDRIILTAAPLRQWRVLVLGVLEKLDPADREGIVIAFDALDVCSSSDQQQILELFKTTTLPIKFIISSLPQRDIYGLFGGCTLSDLPHSQRIINLSNPVSKRDMAAIIQSRLPTLEESELERIIDLAGGQICILHSFLQDPDSYAEVYKRYRDILSRATGTNFHYPIFRILYYLIYLDDSNKSSINTIATFWKEKPHAIRIALYRLESVIAVPPQDDQPLTILDDSFRHFLQEEVKLNLQSSEKLKQLPYQAFIRSLELAEGLSPSRKRELPLGLYTKWIDIGPQLDPDSGVDFSRLKERLRSFDFQKWKATWADLSGSCSILNGGKFRTWTRTFSKVS
ncbi:hypothetical protein AX16_005148 [Volvariella volvacea WC 439]|nr:hypothetical protein AX16_005148 [Volvariella volvacea WC 439]